MTRETMANELIRGVARIDSDDWPRERAIVYPRTGVRVRWIDCDRGVVDVSAQRKTLRR
jgi:hypothetical protein